MAEPQLYRRRWLMLIIFCSYSASNAYQWNQYASISNIITKFYGESAITVNWLSITYMAVYFFAILPVNWFLDKYGLYATAIFASGLNALAACLKLPSAAPDLFWLTFAGQIIAALSNVFILGIPAQQAAVWFGAKEVALATAIGVLGNQFGIALGFLAPPLFVDNPDPWDPIRVQKDIRTMFYVTAVLATLQFLLVLVVYQERPPTPPSKAQAAAVDQRDAEGSLETIKTLFKQRSFVLLFITYGLNTGVFYAVSTVLNNMITAYYKDAEKDVGGVHRSPNCSDRDAGISIIGFWLDKTHTYRWTTVFVYFMSLTGTVAFTIGLVTGKADHIWVLYVTAGVMGLFMTGYLPLGFEFAAEITYPISEGMTSGLLNASAQFLGTLFIIVVQVLIDRVTIFGKEALSGLLLLDACLLIGFIITFFITEDRKRQTAEISDSFTPPPIFVTEHVY